MEIKPLICPNCGGKIDRKTLTCTFCGIEFALDNEAKPIVVKMFNPRMETLQSRIIIPREALELGDLEEAQAYALKELSRQLADRIMPFMEVRTSYEPIYAQQTIHARVRLLRPDYRFSQNIFGDEV